MVTKKNCSDDGIAELFDLEYAAFDEDLPFYEQLAQQANGPLLELGVGTGRVAIALASLGYDVCGIDNSESMLARARRKAEGLPDLMLALADMRKFSFAHSFALVFAGYGAFHHLLSTEDQLACLRCVERHLVTGGRFVFDLRPVFGTDWHADPGETITDWTRTQPDGTRVTKLRSVAVDRATQVQRETYHFDCIRPDGSFKRVTASVDLRFSTRYEIEWLLREAGLELEHRYGDYTRSPFDSESDLMITVARKRGPA
jgi:SAM-dependent methyltransferase